MGWLTTAAFACALGGAVGCNEADAEGAPGEPRLGDVMRTPALIAEVERLAADACGCTTARCRTDTQLALDVVIAKHADVILLPPDRARVQAAAVALLRCGATTTPANANGDSDGDHDIAGPSDSDHALAALMRAVKQRCRCEASDQKCITDTSKSVAMAIAASEGLSFQTAQEATRRSLVFEAQECAAPIVAAPKPKGAVGGASPPKPTEIKGISTRGISTGKVQSWRQLPRSINGLKHLIKVGGAQETEAIGDIWGARPAEVLAKFPKAVKREVDDLEPDTVRLRLALADVDGRGRPLILEWAFLDGRLFMVTVELKRTAPRIVAQLEKFMGRPPDTRTVERWKMEVATWRDSDLLLRATIDGRSNDFALANPKDHATYTERRAKVRPAYLANRKGLFWLLGRPLKPAYAKVEGALLEALRVAPDYGHANVNLCRLYMLRGQFRAAKGRCRKARDGRNTSAHAESALYTGKLAMLSNDPTSARKWLRLVATYDAADESLVPSAARHLRVIAGKGSKRDMGRVMRRVHCAQVEGATKRAEIYARSYGFATAAAATTKARAKGVDLEASRVKADKRCGR